MANSTPFYDDLFTTTASVFHTNNSADDWSLTQCQDYSGFAFYRNYGVAYTWNGLPVRSSVNDGVNDWVAGSQIILAFFGIVLNIHCARVIVRNPNISWPVRFYLLFDCLSRGIDSICFFYKCYCVLTWECVNPSGSPLSGLMINKIVTSFYLAMIYSMQMIANGLCTNRIFAVFFDGRFYSKMERIALPHSIFLWIIPVVIYCYQIGDVVNKETGFVCYGCWYFSPLHYCTTCLYSWNDLAQWFLSYLDNVMYGLFGATFALDLVTLWKVRQIENSKPKIGQNDRQPVVELMSAYQ